MKTDYEIKINEHQKMSDVFDEVGLPTNARGKRSVHIVAYTDSQMKIDSLERIGKVAISELEDWGFLDTDIEHDVTVDVMWSDEYSLMIYTL